MKLPIELIPNTDPPKFKWTKEINSLIGISVVNLEATLPSNVEDAVVALIKLVEKQDKEIETLNRRGWGPDGLTDIIIGMGKRLEKYEKDGVPINRPVQVPIPQTASQMTASQLAEAQKSSLKKPKG